MPPSVARGLLNLRNIEIRDCLSMEEVITKEKQQGEGIMTLFPLLEKLELYTVPKLGHFFLTECTLEIPFLKEVHISDCPEMKTFVQQGISASTPSLESVNNNDEMKVVDLNKAMFSSKVSCPNLEELYINGATSISALCSHQHPTAYFSKLERLEVNSCGKLRNLMSPSVARGALNLRILNIRDCQSMKELIDYCPAMETFVQQGISVSTPSLESVNNDDEVKVVDLNKAMFNSKVCCPSLEELLIWGPNSISSLYSAISNCLLNKLERLEVKSCGKLRNLMSPSVARGALNLRILNIGACESMKEVITEEEQGEDIITNEPFFPQLEKLELFRLPKLGHFFLTEHALKFPFLKKVLICLCPEMKPLVQQGISVSTPSLESVNNDDEVKVDDLNKAMFNYKVSCPNLEYLYICDANSISALCSHQLPTAYFSKLETLYIMDCGKLRNLMSPSVARGLLNLRKLDITDCDSMEEAAKAGHFFLTECTLEIPILRYVLIDYCPEMKTFVQQGISVSTPSLESVNNDDEVKIDDLNKWTQQRFNSRNKTLLMATKSDLVMAEPSDVYESKAS
ncbi:hypothetical protein R3W88_019833 [Solanum pinnatisectum]|uniref:Disease resistance protein At4g27190-like leucine-rich repeats domain-containing protein n=1 Tax=Solanum pinnatisectum TaxID=50273 RepID=A0AAV9KKV3_9SOLN|nr:hypothetical protein R3W88_019833 [Solanum pinnatisectum]